MPVVRGRAHGEKNPDRGLADREREPQCMRGLPGGEGRLGSGTRPPGGRGTNQASYQMVLRA